MDDVLRSRVRLHRWKLAVARDHAELRIHQRCTRGADRCTGANADRHRLAASASVHFAFAIARPPFAHAELDRLDRAYPQGDCATMGNLGYLAKVRVWVVESQQPGELIRLGEFLWIAHPP